MLLKIVAFARYIGGHFNLVRQPDAGDFAERGIRFLGRHCTDIGADTTFLGRTLQLARPFLMKRIKGELQRWRLAFCSHLHARLAYQLIDSRQNMPLPGYTP